MQDPEGNLEVQRRQLSDLLQQTAVFLWKEWPPNMELSRMDGEMFVLQGECPHCGKEAAFPSVTSLYRSTGAMDFPEVTVGAARCIACNDYILGILETKPTRSGARWVCAGYYPLGKPDDSVAEEIPDEIKPDFQEALRCRWVDAYNATLEMCRRALESSCIREGANPDIALAKMIDWVHGQGKITTPLRDMAHKIKLGENRGAHPSDRETTKQDADAVIEFTREYFQHVYVMPARMAKFNFDKPKKG